MAQEMESFNEHLFDEFVLEALERRLEMAQFPLLPGGEPPPAQADHLIGNPTLPHCVFHGGLDDVFMKDACLAHGGHDCTGHDGHSCIGHESHTCVFHKDAIGHHFCAPHGGHTCVGHGGHTCAGHGAHCLGHAFTCVEHGMSCFQHVEPPQIQHPHGPHTH
jgi:hypothetical protein